MNPCPEGCCRRDQLTARSRSVHLPYLQNVRSEAIQHTRVKTSFTLCDESDARFAFIRVGYEAAVHCGAAHLRLLRALPTIRMAEDELDVRLHRVPERGAVRVGIDDERARTAEEVCEEVGEDVDCRLAGGERGEAHAVHFEFHVLGSQTQLEAWTGFSDVVPSVAIRHLQLGFDPAFVFCLCDGRRAFCFCTGGHYPPMGVIVHDSGYF